VYDGPQSPKRSKKDESWRPWASQNTVASDNTISVSTPDRRSELFDREISHQSAKKQATPRPKTIYLTLILDALRAKPAERSSLEDIIDWLRTNRTRVYQEYGVRKLRQAIQTSLNFQTKKVESKRTVWEYSDGTYQLHNAVAAVADDDGSLDKHTERQAYTPSLLISSSVGRQTPQDTSEPCENMSTSKIRHTRERYYANSENIPPAIVSQTQAESRLASTESQRSHPSSEADAQIENENLASNEAVPSAATAVGHLFSQNEVLAPSNPAAGSISVAPNNEPSNTVESQAPANPCDDSGQDGQDEPDYGQIVRKLHCLKQERKLQAQKIEAGHKSLPDVKTLTQSAGDAQRAADGAKRAADEAQRIADEAQRAAENAKKAVEDAEAKQSHLAADKLYLEKLNEDSGSLRAQLDID
jgi:hypothetical protein